MIQDRDWPSQKDQPCAQRVGAWSQLILAQPPGRRGGLENEFNTGQWFHQSYLHNESPVKALDTRAQVSFLGWQCSTNRHTSRCLAPQGKDNGKPEFGVLFQWVSAFGWFWFISFCCDKTLIISTTFSSVLGVVLMNYVKSTEIVEICSQLIRIEGASENR